MEAGNQVGTGGGNVNGTGGSDMSGAGGDTGGVAIVGSGGAPGSAMGSSGNGDPGLEATPSPGKLPQRPEVSDVQGGCTCRQGALPPSRSRGASPALLAMSLAALAISRRRRSDPTS
jgi:hypothetical protein